MPRRGPSMPVISSDSDTRVMPMADAMGAGTPQGSGYGRLPDQAAMRQGTGWFRPPRCSVCGFRAWPSPSRTVVSPGVVADPAAGRDPGMNVRDGRNPGVLGELNGEHHM